MAKNRIFTSDEIFHICKAFLIAQTDGDGYLSGEDLLSTNDEGALEKIDSLSESARRKFMKQVDASIQEQFELFDSLPITVNTEESFREHQSILREIRGNWESDFEKYITA